MVLFWNRARAAATEPCWGAAAAFFSACGCSSLRRNSQPEDVCLKRRGFMS